MIKLHSLPKNIINSPVYVSIYQLMATDPLSGSKVSFSKVNTYLEEYVDKHYPNVARLDFPYVGRYKETNGEHPRRFYAYNVNETLKQSGGDSFSLPCDGWLLVKELKQTPIKNEEPPFYQRYDTAQIILDLNGAVKFRYMEDDEPVTYWLSNRPGEISRYHPKHDPNLQEGSEYLNMIAG